MKPHLAVLVLLVALASIFPFALPPSRGADRPLSRTITLKRTLPDGIFSPDCQLLARIVESKNADITNVEIWDVASGKLRHTLKNPNERVRDFGFSPDGRILAVTGVEVTLWDTYSGRVLRTLHGDSGFYEVDFSPDGRIIAAHGSEVPPCLWDVKSGKLLAVQNEPDFISAFAFAPDGKTYLAADFGYAKRNLIIAETPTGKVLSTLLYEDDIDEATFSPDGQWIVTACNELKPATARRAGKITFWNLKTKKAQHFAAFPNQTVVPVMLNPKVPEIATRENQSLIFFNANTGRPITAPQNHRGDTIALILTNNKSPNPSRSNRTLTLWRTR